LPRRHASRSRRCASKASGSVMATLRHSLPVRRRVLLPTLGPQAERCRCPAALTPGPEGAELGRLRERAPPRAAGADCGRRVAAAAPAPPGCVVVADCGRWRTTSCRNQYGWLRCVAAEPGRLRCVAAEPGRLLAADGGRADDGRLLAAERGRGTAAILAVRASKKGNGTSMCRDKTRQEVRKHNT
jgi:hypothetical protein